MKFTNVVCRFCAMNCKQDYSDDQRFDKTKCPFFRKGATPKRYRVYDDRDDKTLFESEDIMDCKRFIDSLPVSQLLFYHSWVEDTTKSSNK